MHKSLTYYFKTLFIPCGANNFRPKALENGFFFAFIGIIIGIKILSIASFSEFLGADIFNQISQTDIYSLVNNVRAENGEQKLKINGRLEAAAQLKLADMFGNDYFSHNSPQGVTPWAWFDRVNYNYVAAGENLAMNFYSSDEAVRAWLNSESHRKNILYEIFSETGIAVGSGKINGQETVVIVQLLAKPAVPDPVFATVKKDSLTPSLSISPTPKPKESPIVLSKADNTDLSAVKNNAVVQGERTQDKPELKYKAYFSNSILNKFLIAWAVFFVTVLLLKIFVAIKVQFPVLILKSILLIIICLALVFIKDSQFLRGNIIINTADLIIKGINR